MFGLGEAGCIRQLAPDTGLSKWVPLCAVFGISQLRALNGLQQLTMCTVHVFCAVCMTCTRACECTGCVHTHKMKHMYVRTHTHVHTHTHTHHTTHTTHTITQRVNSIHFHEQVVSNATVSLTRKHSQVCKLTTCPTYNEYTVYSTT